MWRSHVLPLPARVSSGFLPTVQSHADKATFNLGVNGCLSLGGSPVIDWQTVKGVPYLSLNLSMYTALGSGKKKIGNIFEYIFFLHLLHIHYSTVRAAYDSLLGSSGPSTGSAMRLHPWSREG